MDIYRVALDYFHAIDTPRALTCAILVRHREWGQLADLRVSPGNYLIARSLALDLMATEFLRKLETLPTGRDLDQAALEEFKNCEISCARANRRLLHRENLQTNNAVWELPDVWIDDFLVNLKTEVKAILGRLPNSLDVRFGPGSTFNDRRPLHLVPDKMSSTPTTTTKAIALLPFVYQTAWGRAWLSGPSRGGFSIVRGDRFASVTKDGTKNRGIGIGPSLLVPLQLALGREIRTRLARWGLDLDQGQETHKRVACEASLTGLYATIDLSSASDTVCYQIVRLTTSEAWFSTLDALRAPFVRHKGGVWHRLSKFSAMGNGYTFELETLLFGAIVAVCMRLHGIQPRPGKNLHVFGDDIICPSEVAPTVLSALRFLGFTPNRKKTFLDGSFRESCGGDYFDGEPVRAHYVKEEPTEPHQIIALANGLRRAMSRFHRRDVVHKRLLRVWHRLLDSLPSDIRRLRGPQSLGDLVIHDNRGWSTRLNKDDPQQMEICCWQPIIRLLPWDHWRSDVVLACALYGFKPEGVPFEDADEISGYRKSWIPLLEREALAG